MDAGFEQQIRERAYEIWVAGGMEDGSADQHWFSAEQLVLSETIMPPVKSAKTAKAAKGAKLSAKSPAKSSTKSMTKSSVNSSAGGKSPKSKSGSVAASLN